MPLSWIWLACAIAVVAAVRITIGVVTHLRQKRQLIQNLDEFTKRIEAMERNAAERAHEPISAAAQE